VIKARIFVTRAQLARLPALAERADTLASEARKRDDNAAALHHTRYAAACRLVLNLNAEQERVIQ